MSPSSEPSLPPPQATPGGFNSQRRPKLTELGLELDRHPRAFGRVALSCRGEDGSCGRADSWRDFSYSRGQYTQRISAIIRISKFFRRGFGIRPGKIIANTKTLLRV